MKLTNYYITPFTLMLLVLTLLAIPPSNARSITISATNDLQQGISDAVVILTSVATHNSKTRQEETIWQRNKKFNPYVLPIQVGTKVSFPNEDVVRHHVYSFSSSKRFELKLYAGNTARPIVFDKPGVVAIGCNIHDWMLAYIVVSDSPYFVRTSFGRATINHLPDGKYWVSFWHPDLISGQNVQPTIFTVNKTHTELTFNGIKLRPSAKREPPPFDESEDY